MAERVPPVETSSTPNTFRARAASISPVLSETEIKARRMGARSGAGGKSGAKGIGVLGTGKGFGEPRRAAVRPALPSGDPP